MIKSSLIELLRSFSSQEFRELGEFVRSPFFNKNSKVIALYDIIKKSYPKLDNPALAKEKVFRKMYPDEKFRDSTLRLVMFYLYESAKSYLQFRNFKDEKVYANVLLTRDLISRDILKEAERTIKESTRLLDETNNKDSDYFWNQYLNNYEILALRERQYAGRYEKYVTGNTFEDLIKYLTNHYLIRVLRLYTVILNVNELYKSDFNQQKFKDILGIFSEHHFKDTPLLEMYFYAARMLEEPENESYFFKFKELLYKEEDNIDHDTVTDLYINLENYCVRRGRIGQSKFDRELFDIYNMEIDKKVYVQGGYMTHYFYKSAATTALIVREFDWVENFINEYRSELMPDNKDSAFYHCYAKLEIARQNFPRALEYLSKVKTDEIYLKTETKLLLAVVFYETGVEDSLVSLLDTLRHFFKNDKFMVEARKIFYGDFVKILNKLVSQKYKSNSASSLLEIQSTIDSKERLFMKNWLQEKAAELEKQLSS